METSWGTPTPGVDQSQLGVVYNEPNWRHSDLTVGATKVEQTTSHKAIPAMYAGVTDSW